MSGQDPLANMQNLIGYAGLVGPNPYLEYQGKIPMAGFYTGDAGNLPPTDAMGRPIQSFVDYNNNAQNQYQQQLAAYNAQQKGGGGGTPGTTLTSIPSGGNLNISQAPGDQPPAGLASMSLPGPIQGLANQAQQNLTAHGVTQDQLNQWQQMHNSASQQAMGLANALGNGQMYGPDTGHQGGTPGMGNQATPFNQALYATSLYNNMRQNQPQSQPSQGTPPSPPDLRQAYLNALANPGKPPMPGAAPPQPGQTQTGSAQQPSVIQAFLAAHPSGGTATPGGGYSNTGFFNTLKQLQGSTA